MKSNLKNAWMALRFVQHIEEHLEEIFRPEDQAQVMCKICDKTIWEILGE